MSKANWVKMGFAGVILFVALVSPAWAATVVTPVFSPGGGMYDTEQTVIITCSTPDVTIRYTIDGSDPNTGTIYDPNFPVVIDHSLTLNAKAWKDGMDPSNLKSAAYQIIVATPTFSVAGGTYNTEQTVTITCATDEATIRYTLDGSDPNNGTIIASGSSVFIDHSLTLKAKAWKGAMTPSGVNSAIYQIVVATPVFTPDGGVYQTAQTVVITCATSGATIRYTIDGSDPNNGTIIANGASVTVSVNPPTFLKAKAFKDGWTLSNIKTAVYCQFAGGSGTAGDPYQINSKEILLALAADSNRYDKCFILTDDIDLNGQVFTRAIIAPDTSTSPGFQGTMFIGTFDGNNHAISGFIINGTSNDYLGLFGSIGSRSEIKNLGIENFSVIGISNSCYLGGLAGYNDFGSIRNCYANGSVSGYDYVGGLVGYNDYGGIRNCFTNSSVNGVDYYVGGLAGYNDYGRIRNCYATGNVSGYDHVGGLAGCNDFGGNIDYCYSTGHVSGSCNIGGLVGENDLGGNIGYCYSTGDVNGDDYVGGLTGFNFSGNISNCYSTGYISGTHAGGLAGNGYGYNGGIRNCYSTGYVSGSFGTGGLIGMWQGNDVEYSFWDIQTSGQTTSDGGTGKTTAQMKTLSTFTSAGWDFSVTYDDEAVWFMPSEPNYPKFVWENRVIAPDFDPDGGVYKSDQTIVISCATSGAIIHYTTNGLDPTESDPIIENGGSLAVTPYPPTILKTKAFKADQYSSEVKTAIYYYADGSGTAEDPYQINSRASLLAFAGNLNQYNKCFILTEDIDMEGQVFSTSIIAADPNHGGTPFWGIFDGNNHKITNFIIQGGNNDYYGLFGQLDPKGLIINLGLENCTVSGNYCTGGLVGLNFSNISNCYMTGNVTDYRCAGGLVGQNSFGGNINNCYSTGHVSGFYCTGGLIGRNGGNINNCYSTGDVNGDDSVGGLIGDTSGSDISNCYSTGDVYGHDSVGGLIGYNNGDSISNCYSIGTVNGNDNIGGLIGAMEAGNIKNCYSAGSVNGTDYVGGLIGNVNVFGGIFSNCFTAGSVSGDNCVGGLIGHCYIYNHYGSISNCYSIANVNGRIYAVGGLVGYAACDIIYCYSTGAVNGSSTSLGGLIGARSSGDASISNSFWDTQTSGRTTSDGGTGKTTAQMKTLSTFTSTGWDFIDTDGDPADWFFPSPSDYPKLFWEVFSQDPDVAMPVFSVAGGCYGTPQNVMITCNTPEAVIHYTTAGLDPSPSDPVIASGGNIYIDNSLTLKARAWKENMIPSNIRSASYQFAVATPVFLPEGGYFLPDQIVTITCVTPGTEIHYTIDGSEPNQSDSVIENGGSLAVSSYPPTILKAKAFKADWPASNIKSSIYYHFAGGTGTAQDPYQINSGTVLLGLAADLNLLYNKSFILTEDIDLGGQVFVAAIIATDLDTYGGFQGPQFTGTFDGNGHKITNFTINGGSKSYLGLFGYIGSGSVIKNIGLENFTVNASAQSRYVGGLVGYNSYGNIDNCYVIGNIKGGYMYVGGLIGYNSYGSISNCYSTINIAGDDEHIGGLVGYNFQGIIIKCHSDGFVGKDVSYNYPSSHVGGLVGTSLSGGSISYSYSACTVRINSRVVGGLVGSNSSNINYCYSSGLVESEYEYVGGLVGSHAYGTINNCYSTGTVNGDDSVGGLIGCIDSGSISNCFSTGHVGRYYYMGGLVGIRFFGSVVQNSFWDTQTSGQTTSYGGTGKTTAQMKTLSTFTSAGWDFTTIWDICEGTSYPRLQWQIPEADWVCPYGVNTEDLNYFVTKWLLDNCTSSNNYCGGVDMDTSGKVDLADFAILAENWLLVDSSGGSNPYMWVPGKTGNALSFDGVDDYVEVSGYKGILGTQSRTCCAWIKTTSTTQGYILSWGADQAGQKWSFRVEANGTLIAAAWGGYVNTTTTVNDGQWHHVATVLDDDGSPTANEILIYIDGILQSTTASSSQPIETVALQDVIIGSIKFAGVPSAYFKGLIDAVCIYGRALDASEINPNALPATGLVAHWAMDETTGTVAHDSVSSYDGTLIGY